MSTQAATRFYERARTHRSPRARAVLALGPLAVLGGIVWAVVQPWRITFVHPHGQGFWFLFVEPPLWVIAVGLVFAIAIAPGVVADLERARQEARR